MTLIPAFTWLVVAGDGGWVNFLKGERDDPLAIPSMIDGKRICEHSCSSLALTAINAILLPTVSFVG